MSEKTKEENLLKKGENGSQYWLSIGLAWILLFLLRIPTVQKYLVAFSEKLPFDIPGIG